MATAKQPDKQLYPGPRRPRPNECWPRLMRAAAALDTMDARIPWHDPTTGRGGLRRVVSLAALMQPDAGPPLTFFSAAMACNLQLFG